MLLLPWTLPARGTSAGLQKRVPPGACCVPQPVAESPLPPTRACPAPPAPPQVFHLLNFLVCGLRSGVFAFRYQVQELPYSLVQAGLLDLPGERPAGRQPGQGGGEEGGGRRECACRAGRLQRAAAPPPGPLPHPPACRDTSSPPARCCRAGLLFFSTYTLLVLFWAEIYYQVRSGGAAWMGGRCGSLFCGWPSRLPVPPLGDTTPP